MPRCPVCDGSVDLQHTPTVPFCSDRCRLIDLGRWLDESYAVPLPRKPGTGELPGDGADGDGSD
ncbi:MAG: DNA gyrase inhibitor YacG [Planctomycetia bacterium]